jgi:hypothetical protein
LLQSKIEHRMGWASFRGVWNTALLEHQEIEVFSVIRVCLPDTQKKLNLKIKYREGFRPFASSALEEDIQEYFDLGHPSALYALGCPAQKGVANKYLPIMIQMKMYECLYQLRSDVPQ